MFWDLTKEEWAGMGPAGRAGYAIGYLGAALALLGVAAWFVGLVRLGADPYGGYVEPGEVERGLPRQTLKTASLLVSAARVVHLGVGLALLGLVVAVLNANKDSPPPRARSAALGAGVALAAAVLCETFRLIL